MPDYFLRGYIDNYILGTETQAERDKRQRRSVRDVWTDITDRGLETDIRDKDLETDVRDRDVVTKSRY